ncbi:MAG: class I SAM-dependent methyltransferase [Novosphingobium sp.]
MFTARFFRRWRARLNAFDRSDAALLDLLAALRAEAYRFVTITPASHARVLARDTSRHARSLTDVFGWSLPFAPGFLPAGLDDLLQRSGMLDEDLPLHRSRVRVSTVGGSNYLHSAYPTSAEDAVFLGPDSYRFADLIADELTARPTSRCARVVDIGVGSGVGALTAASLSPGATILGTDPNPQALRLARINAAAACVSLDTFETSGLGGVDGSFDLALLNPPYIVDEDERAYRHGGGMHGGELSLSLATEALARLAPGGRLILYTGSAIVSGHDRLGAALSEAASTQECTLRYREIDPDVFGEELANPAYAEVDRIALVAAIFTRAG